MMEFDGVPKSALVQPTGDIGYYVSTYFTDIISDRDKPTGLAYKLLKSVAERVSVVNAVIRTRIHQVGAFWKPARYSKGKRGFQIRLRNPRRQPTQAEQKLIEYLEKFIEFCGDDEILSKYGRKGILRDKFHTFLKKITRDRLVYDQINFEIVFNRKGKPVEFFAVDPSTIRFEVKADGTTRIYQVVEGNITAEYEPDEMAWVVANPRSDLEVQGYGYPEVESLVRIVTSILYAEEYTIRFFQSGATPMGYFTITGVDMHQNLIEKFRRMWATQLMGIMGAWKIPIIGLPEGVDLKFEALAKPTDMPFQEWTTFLVNITCAIFQISPDLINFPSRGGKDLAADRDSSIVERKILYHPDRGLYGILDTIAEAINEYIVWKLSPDLEFEFVGIERLDALTELDMRIKSLDFMTINEIRAEMDLPPLPAGDITLNSTYVSHLEREKEMELAKLTTPLTIRAMDMQSKKDYNNNYGTGR